MNLLVPEQQDLLRQFCRVLIKLIMSKFHSAHPWRNEHTGNERAGITPTFYELDLQTFSCEPSLRAQTPFTAAIRLGWRTVAIYNKEQFGSQGGTISHPVQWATGLVEHTDKFLLPLCTEETVRGLYTKLGFCHKFCVLNVPVQKWI